MLSRRAMVAGLSIGILDLGTVSLAETPVPRKAPASALLDSSTLSPGGYVWMPELSPEGPVVIIVSLAEQRVHVYRNGIEIGVSTCSTGKPGHETPTGVFVILQKDRDHHSSTYNNAPMPNMQRLTWRGIALHAGRLPGFPASHGCVRLPREFSRLIFEVTHLGIPVIIADEGSAPQDVVHPGFLLPEAAAAEAMAAVRENAKTSAHEGAGGDDDGIISMIVSGADRKALILHDGVEIWSSPITLKDPDAPLGNHLYKLLDPNEAGAGFTWLAHPIHVVRGGGGDAREVLSSFRIEDWATAVDLLGRFQPGSTLLVTDLAAGEETRTSTDFVIIRDETPVG